MYEYSQINNTELGIRVDKETDPVLYEKINETANRIVRQSEEFEFEIKRSNARNRPPSTREGMPKITMRGKRIGVAILATASAVARRLNSILTGPYAISVIRYGRSLAIPNILKNTAMHVARMTHHTRVAMKSLSATLATRDCSSESGSNRPTLF